MRRLLVFFAWITAAVTALAGCGSTVGVADEPVEGEQLPDPGGASTAPEAVSAWLEALAAGDYGEAAALVYEQQLVLLVAGEGLPAGLVAGYLADGLPTTVRDRFWSSFVESFSDFAGSTVADLAAGAPAVFETDGRTFATVALRGSERSDRVVATRDIDGGWRVDLIATFGAALARPLVVWEVALGDGSPAADCRRALAAQVASLSVAVDLLPAGGDAAGTRAELRALIEAVG